ncbi:MAG: aldo/keto reductase [Bryobacterales bacterium]|nr:aldo/keto reductase [Bryobacterales bacterium]
MSSTRREAVHSITALGLAAAASGAVEIPKRPLGKTGLQVSILGLGGARIGMHDDGNLAKDVVKRCYDLGVTYFDAAAAGAYGLSQLRYGIAFKGLRDKVIFGTKTRHRSATQAQLDLDQSLSNLRTDYLDLYQVHNVINDEDIEFIFGPNGVMEMIEKAKKAGKIRFVGFTGHTDPKILNKMLDRYPFATILMPLSAVDGSNSQKSFERETLPLAHKKGIGVIAMKVLSAGQILQKKAATVEECLRYVWSLPIATTIMGMEQLAHVDTNVALAKSVKPMTASERDSLRRRFDELHYAGLEPWKANRYDVPGGLVYRAD